MPTEGTHNPDVPYVPPSALAWGPRGDQNQKSAADQEYEAKVRRPTAPRPPAPVAPPSLVHVPHLSRRASFVLRDPRHNRLGANAVIAAKKKLQDETVRLPFRWRPRNFSPKLRY